MRDLNLTYDTPSNKAMAAKLQKLNMMRDTNGQPMLLHQSRPETMLHRSLGGAYSGGGPSGGAYSGGAISRIQEMDESVPTRRPPGMVEPHGRIPKYVMANYAAGYPIYDSVELQQLDGGDFWSGLDKFGKSIPRSQKRVSPELVELAKKHGVQVATTAAMALAGLGYKKKNSKSKMKNLEGGNIFEDMSRGFQQFGRTVGRETGKAKHTLDQFGRTVGRKAKEAAPAIGQFAKEQGINLDKTLGKVAVDMAIKKATGGKMKMKGQSARGVLIKKIMKDHGMSMIQASKYIKSNGLY